MPAVTITHFTDPACPFAFSAEPRLRRIEWLYGDQLTWETRMVVLAESREEYVQKGLTPAMLAGGLRKLATAHGMPIDWTEREAVASTVDACRAVVAARLHGPDGASERLLRRLRVLVMADEGLLDDPATIERAAREAGIDPEELTRWTAQDDVEAALRADMDAARDPDPAALALVHKLAPAGDGHRYTCPSLELRTEEMTVAAPGFQPTESYEVAISHLAPGLERRADPQSAEEVLAWAQVPLATAEVAAVMGIETSEAHLELAALDARFDPAGADGYWSLPAAA